MEKFLKSLCLFFIAVVLFFGIRDYIESEKATEDSSTVTTPNEDEENPTSHLFLNYISNNDATIESDGTETAKCECCDLTNTRIDEDSHQVVTNYNIDENTSYSGTLVYNIPQGNGTLFYADLNCSYTGAIENGKAHGEGTYTWLEDSTIFSGTFFEGVATYGKTTTTKTDGLIWYEGAMLNVSEINPAVKGYGYYAYESTGCNFIGAMYAESDMSGCTFDGDGIFNWPSGWQYVGQFENSVATYGKTTTTKTDGLIWYEGAMTGEIVDGWAQFVIVSEELGTGYYRYENTMDYTGQMYGSGSLESCTFHGTGTFNWTTYNEDGSVKEWSNRYIGQFVNGGATGLVGTMYYAISLDGLNSAGLHYFNGIMKELGTVQPDQTGTGKIVFEDGSYYIGDVYLDASNVASVTGTGTYYNADGSLKE